MMLIALMSICVIALVVWLIILFLSITEGVERNWLKKLTSLHAPIRITPTEQYYSSYHYLADALSHRSHYVPRSLQEKVTSSFVDPHDPEKDESIPSFWPKPERNQDGTMRDPVKIVFELLQGLKRKHPDLAFQDFELSGAMLRLQLIRSLPKGEGTTRSFLTQASYLASFSEENPYMKELVMPSTPADINHLMFLSQVYQDLPVQEDPFPGMLKELISQGKINKIKITQRPWVLPFALLPENVELPTEAVLKGKEISHFSLGQNRKKDAVIKKWKNSLLCNSRELTLQPPILIEDEVILNAELVKESLQNARKTSDLRLRVQGECSGIPIKGEIPWKQVEVLQGNLSVPLSTSQGHGVLLSKHFLDNGVRLGDQGFLVYLATTAGSFQEQRLPIFVSGFYDPGILTIGNKCILAPTRLIHMINTTSQVEHFSKTASTGFLIWVKEIKKAKQLAEQIQLLLKQARIDQYWNISTYHDYDFAKGLFQQFQGDRYLFTLIGMMILLVACSNIISLLVILVNDKKKDIGILQALGASRRSIALIFGGAGVCLGVVGSLIGITAAFITLKNLPSVIYVLSLLQGHEVFGSTFFETSLPYHISIPSLIFILTMTPLLSLLAGIIPAYRACQWTPSQILRSE